MMISHGAMTIDEVTESISGHTNSLNGVVKIQYLLGKYLPIDGYSCVKTQVKSRGIAGLMTYGRNTLECQKPDSKA